MEKWITIFCGSSTGNNPSFLKESVEIANKLAKSGFNLMYGGATIGIMGAIADEFLRKGSKVIGVIPEILLNKEVAHQNLHELHVTKTMHERKAIMMDKSDVFLTLPGGYGTMEELFEVVTWRQIGIHEKPIFVFNSSNYFTSLVNWFNEMEEQGFARDTKNMHIRIEDNIDTCVANINRTISISHQDSNTKVL